MVDFRSGLGAVLAAATGLGLTITACSSKPAPKAQSYPDYPSQRVPLQAKLGQDIFVAKYQAILVDGRAVSFAVWTDTVPTALPKTDYVMVQSEDFEKQFFVSWAKLQNVVGPLKPMPDISPARFLTPERMPPGFLASVERDYVPPKGFPDLKQ